MFKNCVFKPNVNTMQWLKAALVRAIKTMAQTALSMLVVGAALSETDWVLLGSVSLSAGIASILTSIVGIKEVPEEVE